MLPSTEARIDAPSLKKPVSVSDENVKLGEAAEPFPVKTAMVAKCVKVFGFHDLRSCRLRV
jgi:hypothetical protein